MVRLVAAASALVLLGMSPTAHEVSPSEREDHPPTAIGEARHAQNPARGLRGDSAAIADAEAMVETMGGRAIWTHLESVHFVHEW